MAAKGLHCEPTLTMNLLLWPYTVTYYYGGAFARCVKGQ
jgi:hypothetical protein